MKKSILIALTFSSIMFTGCDQTPKSCHELWGKIELIGKQSGIPESAIKSQKKEFDLEIAKMPKDQAQKSCQTQLSVLNLIKDQ